jgi:ATP-dependent RNA helicase RhlE
VRQKDLGLSDSVLDAIQPLGYEKPTPIQEQAIPHVINGKDLLGCAQTGTGKTAAFALPMVHVLESRPPKSQGRTKPVRGLILTPTRELASQIDENLRKYMSKSNLRSTVVYGGTPQRRQVDAIRRGVDIIVATPGRLLDLCNQGHIRLGDIEFLVLDEADTMLDMGFLPDITKIIKMCPADRQTLFFSATMPANIVKLSSNILTDPINVQIEAVSSAAETVDQKVYYVRQSDKKDLIVHILDSGEITNALVFTRTKFGADKVVTHLQNNNIASEAIHGNKSQPARERALKKFKQGKVRVLVATDIASRGIDVDELSHVINFELPNLAESYVHRIGRTGRAGRSGVAVSFCNEGEERNHLRGIQKLIGKEIDLITDQPFNMPMEPVGMDYKPSGKGFKKSRNRGSGGGGGGGYGRSGGGGGYGRSVGGGRDRNDRNRGDRRSSDSSSSPSRGYKKREFSNEDRGGRNSDRRDNNSSSEGNGGGRDNRSERSSGGYGGGRNNRSENRSDRSSGGYGGGRDNRSENRSERSSGGYGGGRDNRSENGSERTSGGYGGGRDNRSENQSERSSGGYGGGRDNRSENRSDRSSGGYGGSSFGPSSDRGNSQRSYGNSSSRDNSERNSDSRSSSGGGFKNGGFKNEGFKKGGFKKSKFKGNVPKSDGKKGSSFNR